jgi:hypothetical protein
VRLACGASLVCDVPIVADRLGAPLWLRESGLFPTLEADQAAAEQTPAVDTWSRCTGHPQVFLASEADNALGHNLEASVRGTPLRAASLPRGNGWRALLQKPGNLLLWDPAPLRGLLLRWAKAAHDRRLLDRYQTGHATPKATASEAVAPPDAPRQIHRAQ